MRFTLPEKGQDHRNKARGEAAFDASWMSSDRGNPRRAAFSWKHAFPGDRWKRGTPGEREKKKNQSASVAHSKPEKKGDRFDRSQAWEDGVRTHASMTSMACTRQQAIAISHLCQRPETRRTGSECVRGAIKTAESSARRPDGANGLSHPFTPATTSAGPRPASRVLARARAAPEASYLADPARGTGLERCRSHDPHTHPDSEAVTHRTNCCRLALTCTNL